MKLAMLGLLLASSLAPDPEALGQWEVRDNLLLEKAWGRAVVEAYYRWTPLATLPLADPSERPQKLALLAVSDETDARNLDTYLAGLGYKTERCIPREAEQALAKGGHEMAIVEVDADLESPRRIQAALARSHPSLARSALVAIRKGTGKALTPGETEDLPCLTLPFTDPKALFDALYKASRARPALNEVRLFLRLGSSPPLIGGALVAAALLLLASLACLLPGRFRLAGSALLVSMALAGAWSLHRLVQPPLAQQGPLRHMAEIRETLARDKSQIPSEDLDFLAVQLESGGPRVRRDAAYTWAVAALTCPNDPRRVEALFSVFEDRSEASDFRMRQWAAVALGLNGGAAAVPRLIAAIKDPSPLVRGKVAEALGRIRDQGAIGPLLEMVRDDSWYNAVIARESLRQMGR